MLLVSLYSNYTHFQVLGPISLKALCIFNGTFLIKSLEICLWKMQSFHFRHYKSLAKSGVSDGRPKGGWWEKICRWLQEGWRGCHRCRGLKRSLGNKSLHSHKGLNSGFVVRNGNKKGSWGKRVPWRRLGRILSSGMCWCFWRLICRPSLSSCMGQFFLDWCLRLNSLAVGKICRVICSKKSCTFHHRLVFGWTRRRWVDAFSKFYPWCKLSNF